ncbi:TRAP transporter small permease [uncultured Sphaerochaeta sp.]|uniref:TRAP transporter small permease n=1 Tax=uncultured Sphaerochaeta sp. TaxID=886478 RepID=UPI002A0A90CD|nr:TRAP transporter small permease [uncultured Sphaerochaeta sp.]
MKRFYDGLSKGITWLCLTLLIVYTILVAVQVISRYVFQSPTTWTELVARYLFVWSIMLYMPVLYRQHGNAAFDLLFKKLKEPTRRYVQLLNDGFILACSFYLAKWGWLFCSKMTNKYIMGLGSNIHIPMNVAYLAIPVGGMFLMLMCFEQLLLDLRLIVRGGE